MKKDISTFVVFGAAKSGYGQAITKRLRRDGNTVIGTFSEEYSEDAKSMMKDDEELKLVKIDHSNIKSINEFISSLPKVVSGVVIAQMYFDIRDALEFNEEAWRVGLDVNITLPHFVALSLGPRVESGGCIVTITSTEGFSGSFGAACYAASKAAVHNLVKTHANILGSKGVRVNAIAAGWIGGVMDTDEVFNMSRKITPLGRLGAPEEIAGVTSFLLGPDASFVTGATIVADGGYSCVDTISKYEYENLDL